MKILNDDAVRSGEDALRNSSRDLNAVLDRVSRACRAPEPTPQPSVPQPSTLDAHPYRVTTRPAPLPRADWSARLRAAAVVGCILLASGTIAATCGSMPPVSGCTPFTQRCNPATGRPEVCSATQRWQPAGNLSCVAVGGVCAVDDAGVAYCGRAPDGGTPDAGDSAAAEGGAP